MDSDPERKVLQKSFVGMDSWSCQIFFLAAILKVQMDYNGECCILLIYKRWVTKLYWKIFQTWCVEDTTKRFC